MKRIIAILAAVFLTASALTCSAVETGSPAQSAPVESADTLSAIGSVSKTFVTVAALQIAEEGKIDIDQPVTDYLPEFRMADERYKDITVRMLMNHTSGMMGFTFGNAIVYGDVHTEDHDLFLQRLRTQRLKANPGELASYCNDGFTLLELIVERVSGMSFTDYVETHICEPLGLEQTGTPEKNFGDPHTARVLLDGRTAFAADYAAALGSGGIYSTAPELCRYGTAFFTGDETLLSDQTKAEMNKSIARDRYDDGFGLSWDQSDVACYQDAGVKVVAKGGHVTEQSAILMIAPDEKISVSVLTSGGESMAPSYLSAALLDTILDDRGIEVTHPEPEELSVLDSIPASYLEKADLYACADHIVSVQFPDGRYMELTDLTADNPKPVQYRYTANDCFVLMEGQIGTEDERQAEDQNILTFTKRDGKEYICCDSNVLIDGFCRTESSSYYLQRVGRHSVDTEIMHHWENRAGRKYYLYDGRFSNAAYLGTPCIRLLTTDGYVYGQAPDRSVQFTAAVKDSRNALGFIEMAGSGGSNLKDVRMEVQDGHEALYLTNYALSFIEESAIPDFSPSLHEIPLATGHATWYNIGEMGGTSMIFDIPEQAAVYIYDEYDKVVYSSLMKDYGSEVTLPENGKIVFIGESGAKVGIG